MSNEVVAKNESTYLAGGVDLHELFSEEMSGLTPSFERIKIPAGGGIAFEVPGDDPNNPDLVKSFKAVILHHQPINSYYKEKYDGSNNPPDCASMDGKVGIDSDGVVQTCAECPLSKFGSAEDGKGKACKQKRRIFLLREGEVLPVILTLPTGSLAEYSKYIMRLLSKGKKSNSVVTAFSLKKAQNSGGITYSQAVFAVDRDLTAEEFAAVSRMSEQVKATANSVDVADDAE